MQTTEPDTDDSQAWLDLLAGRDAAEATARTRVEAAWLRAALLTYRAELPAGRVPDPQARLVTLLQKAVDAGVLSASTAIGQPEPKFAPPSSTTSVGEGAKAVWRQLLERSLGRQPWVFAIAMAAVAALSVLLVVRQPDGGDQAHRELRGAAVQVIRTVDPSAEQVRVQAALKAAGVQAAAFVRLGRQGLEVEWPARPSTAQIEALRQLGLQPPEGPSLIIEFARP